jgi:hypothetical protein
MLRMYKKVLLLTEADAMLMHETTVTSALVESYAQGR